MKSFLLLFIRGYQIFISPFRPPTCRYSPTCSAYARAVLQTHSPLRALQLILKRLMSCHPWGGYGYDPPPNGPEPK